MLSQRIALFGWLEEKHLDIPEGEGSKGFLMFAEQGKDPDLLIVYFLISLLDRIVEDKPL